MGLDVFFKDDVARILAGLARAASRYDGEYQQGYFDALGDVAASFGLKVHDLVIIHRATPGDGRRVVGYLTQTSGPAFDR